MRRLQGNGWSVMHRQPFPKRYMEDAQGEFPEEGVWRAERAGVENRHRSP
jgi:hypothetical protein